MRLYILKALGKLTEAFRSKNWKKLGKPSGFFGILEDNPTTLSTSTSNIKGPKAFVPLKSTASSFPADDATKSRPEPSRTSRPKDFTLPESTTTSVPQTSSSAPLWRNSDGYREVTPKPRQQNAEEAAKRTYPDRRRIQLNSGAPSSSKNPTSTASRGSSQPLVEALPKRRNNTSGESTTPEPRSERRRSERRRSEKLPKRSDSSSSESRSTSKSR